MDQSLRRGEFRLSPSRPRNRDFCKGLPTGKLRDYEDIPKTVSDRGQNVTFPSHILWNNIA